MNDKNYLYQPIEAVKFAGRLNSSIPLVDKAYNETKNHYLDKNQAMESLESLRHIIESILSFRAVHLRVAKENFRIRSENVKGSGGYDLKILELLIQSTKKGLDKVNNMRDEIGLW